ncbi:MAG: hypothetical protein HPY50_17995 [Firmicutes bacterium]|nr:hypothetical protein [Bacillota bacterium]
MSDQFKEMWEGWRKMQEGMMDLWRDAIQLPQPKKKGSGSNGPAGSMWDQWMENQERVFEIWKGAVSPEKPEKVLDRFEQQFGELTREWWKVQERMFDAWKESFTPAGADKKTLQQGERLQDMWQGWWKNQERFFGLWRDLAPLARLDGSRGEYGMDDALPRVGRFYSEGLKVMAEGFREYLKWIPDSSTKETFEKTLQGVNVYTALLNFWSGIQNRVPVRKDLERWEEFNKSWMDGYKGVLDSFFSLFVPEQYRKMLTDPTDNVRLYQQLVFNFFRPWIESSDELQQRFIQVLKGDRQAFLEFLKVWQQSFQDSYGRVFQLPTFGLARESFERLMESMESYVRYQSEVNEFTSTIYKVGGDAMESLLRKHLDILAEGKQPESFHEFYTLWWNTNEEAYLELFNTEAFARMLADTTDAWLDFKQRVDALLMDFFGALPVPTRKEMDSLYQTVYQMKRKLRDQGRRIDELLERSEEPDDLKD